MRDRGLRARQPSDRPRSSTASRSGPAPVPHRIGGRKPRLGGRVGARRGRLGVVSVAVLSATATTFAGQAGSAMLSCRATSAESESNGCPG